MKSTHKKKQTKKDLNIIIGEMQEKDNGHYLTMVSYRKLLQKNRINQIIESIMSTSGLPGGTLSIILEEEEES